MGPEALFLKIAEVDAELKEVSVAILAKFEDADHRGDRSAADRWLSLHGAIMSTIQRLEHARQWLIIKQQRLSSEPAERHFIHKALYDAQETVPGFRLMLDQ